LAIFNFAPSIVISSPIDIPSPSAKGISTTVISSCLLMTLLIVLSNTTISELTQAIRYTVANVIAPDDSNVKE